MAPVEELQDAEKNDTGEDGGTMGGTEALDADQEEDTNLDDELRQLLVEGRILPNLEHYAAGLQRQLSSHIRWLRSNRAHWGSLQRSLIHEFQVAMNGGTLLIWMLQQALLYTGGLAPPNHQAQQRSQRMVDEVTTHCDILGRLMQDFSGETMAHDARVTAHMARMEHSPIRQVCARRQGEVASASGSASGTLPGPAAGDERSNHLGMEKRHKIEQRRDPLQAVEKGAQKEVEDTNIQGLLFRG